MPTTSPFGVGTLNALPVDLFPCPAYPSDCASPAMLKEQLRRSSGTSLLCTLSGWVWLLLGTFTSLGAVCSLVVAAGGHTAPGLLGEIFSHHGPLGRRSLLGRSLPVLTWFCFEVSSRDLTVNLPRSPTIPHASRSSAARLPVLGSRRGARHGAHSKAARPLPLSIHSARAHTCRTEHACTQVGSAGAFYVAAFSAASWLVAKSGALPTCLRRLCPHTLGTAGGAVQCWRRCAAGGAEPALPAKRRSLGVHALSVAISVLELKLNDLPVLWQVRMIAIGRPTEHAMDCR